MIDKTFTAFAPRSPRPGEALDVLSKRLWLVQKTGLRKVLIEGKRSGDTEPVHDHEGNAIRQRVRLILMLLKECPAFLKERLINVDESDGRTSQQVIANLDRLVMITTAVKKVTTSSNT